MKHKKEFFGVLISVLVCVFLVYLVVYATTVGTDITVTGDTTVSGNDLTFGNGAAFDNDETDILFLTENLVSIVGNASISSDLNISGNNLTFGNGASISNSGSTILEFTETNLYLDGAASVSDSLWVGGAITGNTIYADGIYASNSLDFDEFKDAPTLDTNLVIGGDYYIQNVHTSISEELTIGSDDISFIGEVASISGNLNVNGTITGTGAVASDAIDFDEIVDNATLDTNWIISGEYYIQYPHASISDDLTIGNDDISFIGGVASISETLWVGSKGTFNTGASISDGLTVGDRADFGSVVSVSEAQGLLVADGATLMFGPASPTQAAYPCNRGSMFIRTDIASLSLMLNFCDGVGEWTSLASCSMWGVEIW